MTEQAILEAVQEIFRDNFDDDTLVITRETCADDIEDWDSLEPPSRRNSASSSSWPMSAT